MARRRSAMDSWRPAAVAGMPVSISARMASGRSLRGLSEVTHARSASRAAIAAHDRALAAVAVAAAAEHHAEARAGLEQLARGGEHVLERVRGVGVVDHHQERLAGLHALEAPRDGRDPGEDPADPRGLHLEGQADAHRPEQVHHVVLAHQRGGDLDRAARRGDLEPDAVHPGLPAERPQLGGGAEAEGQDPHPRIGRGGADHGRARRIVDVHHRGAARLAARARAGRTAGPSRRGTPRASCGSRDGPG